MLIWHYIPPVLYTLIIPGIVFSYGLNYRFSENVLIWYLLLGGGILVWKSWYVNYPTKLIFIFKNFKASWFSREIIAYGLFFLGLAVQLVYPQVRSDVWIAIVFLIGLLGIFSTILIYHQNLLLPSWPILMDFFIEGLFMSTLVFWMMFLGDSFFNSQVINQGIIAFAILWLKLIKDFFISMYQFAIEQEWIWLMIAGLAILAVTIMLGDLLGIISVVFLSGVNSFLLRVKFFIATEYQSQKIYLNLCGEYHKNEDLEVK